MDIVKIVSKQTKLKIHPFADNLTRKPNNYLRPGYERVEAIVKTDEGLRTVHLDIPKDKN